MTSEGARGFSILEQRFQVSCHLLSVPGEQKVCAFRKQSFGIFPRRAHQRNAAGERFEWADRGDTREGPDVRTARNMHRNFMPCEHLGDFKIWQPAPILDAGVLQSLSGSIRKTNAVNAGLQ